MSIVFMKPIERTENMLSFHLCLFKLELSIGKHYNWRNLVICNVSFQKLTHKGDSNATG
jgi:hypothetical protein